MLMRALLSSVTLANESYLDTRTYRLSSGDYTHSSPALTVWSTDCKKYANKHDFSLRPVISVIGLWLDRLCWRQICSFRFFTMKFNCSFVFLSVSPFIWIDALTNTHSDFRLYSPDQEIDDRHGFKWSTIIHECVPSCVYRFYSKVVPSHRQSQRDDRGNTKMVWLRISW